MLVVDESSLKSLVSYMMGDRRLSCRYEKDNMGDEGCWVRDPLKLRREGSSTPAVSDSRGAFDKYSIDSIYSWFRISIYNSYS